MNKESLRAHFRELRLRMSSRQVAGKSKTITEKLIDSVDWSGIEKLHIYESMTSLREVDSRPLIKYLEANWPNIKIYIQVKDRQASITSQKFDLIIVPVLAFDSNCNRLGWGGGWYDRFLAGQPKALKVGLAYQNGFEKNGLPNEAHDIPLDKIITEQGIITKS